MIVIAHRGASAERPENTLAAFERAIEVGADMIEMDLRVSRDGVVHVAHDPVVGRDRRSLDWSRIRALAGPEGRHPGIGPVLDALAGRIALNLELKERRAVAPLIAEIRKQRLGEGLLLSAFDQGTMRQVRALAPELARGALCRRVPLRLGAALRAAGARSLHIPLRAATPRAVAAAQAAGVPVYVWTVDDPADLRRLAAIGVRGVFTNDPRRARELFPARSDLGPLPVQLPPATR